MGLNLNSDELSAAIGRVQLAKVRATPCRPRSRANFSRL
jgi:hypothetical protein